MIHGIKSIACRLVPARHIDGLAQVYLSRSGKSSHLQSLLVDPSAASQIRDALAQVLLRNKGELVLRLGRHPNVGALWAAGDAGADIEDARGTPLSYEEHEICITQLNAAIEDIGGFVS